MSKPKIRNDATASTRGTIYHLCVAVAKCYELKEGQKLLIEELGDVTIENEQQIEVKQYSDSLTDGHHNFWNALKNWSENEYDHTPYSSLILHTTQEFGAKATIAEWNAVDTKRRLELLLAINKEFEKAYEKAKATDSTRVPSAVLKLQRFLLDTKKQTKLEAIISKVWIETKAKELPSLYEELKQAKIRGILSGKKDDYLNSLIGFVCRPDKKAGDRWEITYEMFEAKLGNLNATYNNETRHFPQKHFAPQESADDGAARDDLFVKKIRDIEYSEVICKAIHEYEATITTLDEEFEMYTVDPTVVENYCAEVVDRFQANYRIACRKCSDEVVDSQNLFDTTISSPASSLPGFGDTPDGFRNGLLHQRMNIPEAGLEWRLRKK